MTKPKSDTQSLSIGTKSSRSVVDDQTPIGKACGNSMEGVMSSIGGAKIDIKFTDQIDLSCAGVLLSIPGLLNNGLLTHSQDFNQETGHYSVESVFLSLAFLSLLLAKNMTQSDKIPRGELGRAIGLDRIPEVKTLRQRIDTL